MKGTVVQHVWDAVRMHVIAERDHVREIVEPHHRREKRHKHRERHRAHHGDSIEQRVYAVIERELLRNPSPRVFASALSSAEPVRFVDGLSLPLSVKKRYDGNARPKVRILRTSQRYDSRNNRHEVVLLLEISDPTP